MKKTKPILSLTFLLTFALLTLTSCANTEDQTTEDTSTEKSTIGMAELMAANDELYAGLNEMFEGNMQTLENLWSHSDSITYMGPFGGILVGWDAIGADFKAVTQMKLGGKIAATNVHAYAGSDVGYVSCVEEGENMGPDGNPVNVSHRATNIYRIEDGQWRLMHHHTDISTQLEETFDKVIE